jgi:hypothetical protein
MGDVEAAVRHSLVVRAREKHSMPVRLLNSPVLVWPRREQVDAAVRRFAASVAPRVPGLVRLGYFGSYARGDYGVGSDLDLVAVVAHSARPFVERGCEWDVTGLPVPAEILVYTEAEWAGLMAGGGRMARALAEETVWIYRASTSRAVATNSPAADTAQPLPE